MFVYVGIFELVLEHFLKYWDGISKLTTIRARIIAAGMNEIVEKIGCWEPDPIWLYRLRLQHVGGVLNKASYSPTPTTH